MQLNNVTIITFVSADLSVMTIPPRTAGYTSMMGEYYMTYLQKKYQKFIIFKLTFLNVHIVDNDEYFSSLVYFYLGVKKNHNFNIIFHYLSSLHLIMFATCCTFTIKTCLLGKDVSFNV